MEFRYWVVEAFILEGNYNENQVHSTLLEVVEAFILEGNYNHSFPCVCLLLLWKPSF